MRALRLTLEGLNHRLLLAGFAHSWLFPEQRSRVGLEHRLLFAAGFLSSQANEQPGPVLQHPLLLFQLLQRQRRQIKNWPSRELTAHKQRRGGSLLYLDLFAIASHIIPLADSIFVLAIHQFFQS